MFKINNLLLVLLFIINIPKLYSQSAVGKGQVNGKIIDEKSVPVIYAAVDLLNAADSTKFKADISDVNGGFSFTNIPPRIEPKSENPYYYLYFTL